MHWWNFQIFFSLNLISKIIQQIFTLSKIISLLIVGYRTQFQYIFQHIYLTDSIKKGEKF